jgi:hypothetical protein
MDKLIEAKNRIKDAILAMHPLLNTGDTKEEELYLALYNLNDVVHERVMDELLSVPQANELLPDVSVALLPDMEIEEAEVLSMQCDYACFAAETDENEINTADASAFFLEGYLEAQRRLKRN